VAIPATHPYLRARLAHRRGSRVKAGVLGMRLREGTISAEQLRAFLGTLPVPLVGMLRDTQNYVHTAARGLTLWDIAPSRVERDLEQWQPILAWIEA
jgi:chromosome partitioning protein